MLKCNNLIILYLIIGATCVFLGVQKAAFGWLLFSHIFNHNYKLLEHYLWGWEKSKRDRHLHHLRPKFFLINQPFMFNHSLLYSISFSSPSSILLLCSLNFFFFTSASFLLHYLLWLLFQREEEREKENLWHDGRGWAELWWWSEKTREREKRVLCWTLAAATFRASFPSLQMDADRDFGIIGKCFLPAF